MSNGNIADCARSVRTFSDPVTALAGKQGDTGRTCCRQGAQVCVSGTNSRERPNHHGFGGYAERPIGSRHAGTAGAMLREG